MRGDGKDAIDGIFPRPSDGKSYSNANVAERLQNVRNRAGVRSTITMYSFRHLWISEMRMAGVDVLHIGRMAGTSVALIERVYGHFRTRATRRLMPGSTWRERGGDCDLGGLEPTNDHLPL